MSKKTVVDAQEMPQKNAEKAVWDIVIKDIKQRDRTGAKKYGVRLQPFNGRNALIDAYQEALDLVVYLRQAILEKEELVLTLKHYADPYNYGCDSVNCSCTIDHRLAEETLKKIGELS